MCGENLGTLAGYAGGLAGKSRRFFRKPWVASLLEHTDRAAVGCGDGGTKMEEAAVRLFGKARRRNSTRLERV